MGKGCVEAHGPFAPWVSRRDHLQQPVKRRDWGKGRGQELGVKDLLENYINKGDANE